MPWIGVPGGTFPGNYPQIPLTIQKKEAASSPEEQKLEGTVKRSTLLKLVLGMAKQWYAYDPAAKRNKAIAKIHTDLQLHDLRLDEDTIRQALKDAAEMFPPTLPKT